MRQIAFTRVTVLLALSMAVACVSRPQDASPIAGSVDKGSGMVQDPITPPTVGDIVISPEVATRVDPQSGQTARTGSVGFNVKWPERSGQAIPAGAAKIDLRGTMPNQSTLWTTSIVRPAATGSLTDIPEGTISIEAKAKDGANTVLATGSADVLIKANQKVQAKITLGGSGGSGGNLVFTSFDPPHGFLGDVIALVYSGNSTDPTVKFGAGITASTFKPFGKTTLSAIVPAGAKSGKITLDADGLSVQSTDSFMVIASVLVSPSSPGNVSPGGQIQFTATAVDPDNATFSSPILTCSVAPDDGRSCLSAANCPTLSPSLLYKAGPAGRDKVTCGKAGSSTTVLITVQ